MKADPEAAWRLLEPTIPPPERRSLNPLADRTDAPGVIRPCSLNLLSFRTCSRVALVELSASC